MKREQLFPELASRLNLRGTFAEVGVLRGMFSSHLLKANPSKLCLIDPWLKYEGFDDYKGYTQADWDAICEKVRLKFSKHPNVQIIRATSEGAAASFRPGSLDLVYIDANHSYESIKQDIQLWLPKVRRGGVISGHDFNLKSIRTAVSELIGHVEVSGEKGITSWYKVV